MRSIGQMLGRATASYASASCCDDRSRMMQRQTPRSPYAQQHSISPFRALAAKSAGRVNACVGAQHTQTNMPVDHHKLAVRHHDASLPGLLGNDGRALISGLPTQGPSTKRYLMPLIL